jgi:two-component system C4-dicarboxylate transport response regulator DctD
VNANDAGGACAQLACLSDRSAKLLDCGLEAPGAGLAECVSRYEAELICETLAHTQGSAKRAMEFLKLPRKTFYDKINRYGIRLENYRGKPEA